MHFVQVIVVLYMCNIVIDYGYRKKRCLQCAMFDQFIGAFV